MSKRPRSYAEPVGITETLEAPGVVPVQTYSRGAQLASQLAQSLGVIGQIAVDVRQQQSQNLADERYRQNQLEQAQNKADALRDHEDAVLRGQGARFASAKLPLFAEAISREETQSQDPEADADKLISEATADMTPQEAKGFSDSIRDNLVSLKVARRQELFAKDREENASDLSASLMSGVPSQAVAKVAKDLGFTDSEVDGMIFAPAAELASKQGNRDTANGIMERFGGKKPALSLVVDSNLKAYDARQQQLIEKQSRAQLDTMLLNGAGFESIEVTGRALLAEGKIDPEDLKTRIDQARTLSHRRIESALGNAVTDGALSQKDLEEQFKALSQDPFAANYLSEQSRKELLNRAAANIKAKSEGIKADLDKLNYGGADFAVVKARADEALAAGAIDADDAAARVNTARSLAHQRTESVLGNAVTDGLVNEAGLREEFNKLSLDPIDPNYLSQSSRNSLLERAASQVKLDESKRQAAQVIAGGDGVLNENQHGSAVTTLIGPGPVGSNIIDSTGKITEPAALATVLARAEMTPVAIRQTIMGNLQSPDGNRAIDAAKTIGLLSRSGSRAWGDLYERNTSKLDRALMLKARMEFDASPTGELDINAIGRIREVGELLAKNPELATPPSAEQLKNEAGIDLASVSGKIMEKARANRPWAIDTFGGIDFINPDPSLTDYSDQASLVVQNAFRDYYTTARIVEPAEKAQQQANDYAQQVLESKYDYVRWGSQVHVVPADVNGTPLPSGLRWGNDFESEARGDLAELRKIKSTDTEVQSMRPHSSKDSAGNDVTGWAYVLDDGSLLTDESGNVAIWTPSPQTQKAREAADKRDKLNKLNKQELPLGVPFVTLSM